MQSLPWSTPIKHTLGFCFSISSRNCITLGAAVLGPGQARVGRPGSEGGSGLGHGVATYPFLPSVLLNPTSIIFRLEIISISISISISYRVSKCSPACSVDPLPKVPIHPSIHPSIHRVGSLLPTIRKQVSECFRHCHHSKFSLFSPSSSCCGHNLWQGRE